MQKFEDQLFDILSEGRDHVQISKFVKGLRRVGILDGDPRLLESVQKIKAVKEGFKNQGKEVAFDKETFLECIKNNIILIRRAFTDDFVIPDFQDFCKKIEGLYTLCKSNNNGKLADYIPQLSQYNPDYWGVSICTVDGQRYSHGDTAVPFSMQSCSKPLSYALALSELGSDTVHNYIGHEPSGEQFNVIKLNPHKKPHNPMINAGAILVCSLLQTGKNLADRFDYVHNRFKSMAAGGYVGFNNAMFLSERSCADRNFAIGYYMRENNCFPQNTNLLETLEFYFQMCSVEITAESGAMIAATLANGGICPISEERILDGDAVRNTLALMLSCGMYDYSGEFAFTVGLPGKSGVSGCILLVIPNVMGVCLWSPPLDPLSNSCRGIQFSKELVRTFNFHHYDNLRHSSKKLDPRMRHLDKEGSEVTTLLFGAASGDLSALQRMVLDGVDMKQANYDGRTALHLAAAEGKTECLRFLLEICHVPLTAKDRWGQTPVDDAVTFNRTEALVYLRSFEEKQD